MAEFTGIVVSGFGEGGKFLSMPSYEVKFQLLLGFKPFPGTLNLKVDAGELQSALSGMRVLRIEPFEENGRKFGGISVYPVRIEGTKAFLVVPDINRHSEQIVEFIAEENLRDKLSLKDGKEVKVLI